MAEGTMLMLIVTLDCSSRCAHCCVSAGPEKAHLQLGKDDMLRYIVAAYQAGITGVIFTGGEPTLCLDDLYEPMELSQSLGIYTDLRTNAHWATSKVLAYDVLDSLKASGLQRLGLSYDSYHEQYIPQDCVQNAIVAAQELGLQLYLDWIGFETIEYVADRLSVDQSVIRAVMPPARIGAAVNLSDDYFASIPIEDIEKNQFYSLSCGKGEGALVTVFPGGYASYHECCWVNPRLLYKMKDGDWIAALKVQTQSDPAVKFLAGYGIGGLIRKARQECPEWLKPYYSHQCEVCYNLLPHLFPRKVVARDGVFA